MHAIPQDQLAHNPTPRLLIVLCLDTSFSMTGDPITKLQEGVDKFFESINNDPLAKSAAEVCVVTFGGQAEIVLKFAPLSSLSKKDREFKFQADGGTPMGEAILIGLKSLTDRMAMYREKGIDLYSPWFVLMTDGKPTDLESVQQRARGRIKEMVKDRGLSVFPIGIGDAADMEKLKTFSPSRAPLRLDGLKFEEFFEWLSKSVQQVSRSIQGEPIMTNPDAIKQWSIV